MSQEFRDLHLHCTILKNAHTLKDDRKVSEEFILGEGIDIILNALETIEELVPLLEASQKALDKVVERHIQSKTF